MTGGGGGGGGGCSWDNNVDRYTEYWGGHKSGVSFLLLYCFAIGSAKQ